MNKWIILILLFCLTLSLYSAELKIQRDRSALRSGAGSWHQIIAELPLGTLVTTIDSDLDDMDSDQWLKVDFKGKQGYISIASTKKAPPKNNVFQAMAKEKTDVNTSRHGVSAGVKGFGERFSKTFKGDQSFVELALNYQVNPKEYKKFKKETYKDYNVNKNKRNYMLLKKPDAEYFTFSEEGFGLGVASAIASQGIYNNMTLHDYVNYLGLMIVDASDVTDINFKFFVLDLDVANAYACPGGYIFVTKGMIQSCQNEAELITVLAHEIAHVIYAHGMNELEKRKNHIFADQSFDELDEEMPTEDEEISMTEKEMEEEAFSMYETIVKGRLDAYEKEADEMGMILSARAGYNPTVLSSLLNRLSKSNQESNNQHYRLENIKQRSTWVDSFLARNKFSSQLMINDKRFVSFKSLIKY